MTFTSPFLAQLRAAREQATPSAAPEPQAAPPRPVPSSPPPSPPQAQPRPLPDLGTRAPPPPDLGDMPPHLARMVAAAQRGELPRGVHLLESGLVMDLGGYVLAWAECWPRDRAHLTRRLGEAYAALRQA